MSRRIRRSLSVPADVRARISRTPTGLMVARIGPTAGADPRRQRLRRATASAPAISFPEQDNYDLSEEQLAVLKKVLQDTQSDDRARAESALAAWNAAIHHIWPMIPALGASIALGAGLANLLFNLMGEGIWQEFLGNGDPVGGGLKIDNDCFAGVLTHAGWSAIYSQGGIDKADFTWSGNFAFKGISVNPITGHQSCVSCAEGTNVDTGEQHTNVSTATVAIVAIPGSGLLAESASGDSNVGGGFSASFPGHLKDALGNCPNPRGLSDKLDGPRSRTAVMRGADPGDCMTVSSADSEDTVQVCIGQDPFDYDPGDIGDIGGIGDLDDFCKQMQQERLAQYQEQQDEANSNGDTAKVEELQAAIDKILDDQANGVCEADLNLDDPGGIADCLMDPSCSGDWFNDYPPPTNPGDFPIPPPPDTGFNPLDPGFPCTPETLPPPITPPDPGDVPPVDVGDIPIDDIIGDIDEGLPNTGIGTLPGEQPPFDGGFPDDGFNPGDPGNIGLPDGPNICGIIDPSDPGNIGVITPPWTDPTFTKRTCYKNQLITAIAAQIGKELGINTDIWVTKDCKERWTGCFEKGVNKFDALKFLADKCGYGIFPNPCDEMPVTPDPNDPVIQPRAIETFPVITNPIETMPIGNPGDICFDLGNLEPLPIWHGPYHEDQNLYVFEPVYDSLDVVSHVQIVRPDYPGLPGFEIVLEVPTVYRIAADKWHTEVVGSDTSYSAALNYANKLVADRAAKQAKIECAVPYNPRIYPRHQFWVLRPTLNFYQKYMVTGLTHECSKEEGYITKISGVIYFPPPPGSGPPAQPPIPEPEPPKPPPDPGNPNPNPDPGCDPDQMNPPHSLKPVARENRNDFIKQYGYDPGGRRATPRPPTS